MRHFTIDLSTRQFSQAKDIRKNFFEYNGITDFTYGIKIRKESALYSKHEPKLNLLKIGMSAKQKGKDNRLTRQLGGLPGFAHPPHDGGSSYIFVNDLDKFMCYHGITKDDLEIEIRNFSFEVKHFDTAGRSEFLREKEKEWQNEYKEEYGHFPLICIKENNAIGYKSEHETLIQEENKMNDNKWQVINKQDPQYDKFLKRASLSKSNRKYDWQGLVDEVSSDGHAIRVNNVKLSPPAFVKKAGIEHKSFRDGKKFVTVFKKAA